MSTTFGTTKCPQCGGVYTYNFNCRTQEEYGSCISCGRSTSNLLKRDPETGDIDREEDTYKLGEDLCFIISDIETGEPVSSETLTKETTTADVENFMRKKDERSLLSGRRNVYYKGEPLWQYMDRIEIRDGYLLHKKAVYCDNSMDGYGMVGFAHEKGQYMKHLASQDREDVLSFIEKANAEGTPISYVTWWNPATRTLETLYGEPPMLENFEN